MITSRCQSVPGVLMLVLKSVTAYYCEFGTCDDSQYCCGYNQCCDYEYRMWYSPWMWTVLFLSLLLFLVWMFKHLFWSERSNVVIAHITKYVPIPTGSSDDKAPLQPETMNSA